MPPKRTCRDWWSKPSEVSFFAALGLPHLDTRRQDIQTTAAQVIADYRWARNRAITSGVHFGTQAAASSWLVRLST